MAPAFGADADAQAALSAGGVVIAFRHALAPGTFDPPGFKLGECSTQRNLNDDGRAQARRIGEWFEARRLAPARVLTSPWCRCIDTARIAFGRAQVLEALGSPRGASEQTNARSLQALRAQIIEASARRDRFDVWVTHMFVLQDLLGQGTASGEGLVLRAAPKGDIDVLARLLIS